MKGPIAPGRSPDLPLHLDLAKRESCLHKGEFAMVLIQNTRVLVMQVTFAVVFTSVQSLILNSSPLLLTFSGALHKTAQENIATHHRPIPPTHQGTSGCAARCRLLRPGNASPRAPCAWSFQGQPVLTPVFSRACFPQTGGAEQIPSNLSHRQHSRWQAQCWRQGPKSTRRVCTRRYLRSPGISPNNTHRLLQLPAQGINHFPVGYHFLSCVSCAFLIG